MSLNLTIPQTDEQLKPRITVIGVGGAGGNAVNNMIHSNLEGVEFLISNTDAQALQQSPCARKIQLGRNLTRGLGAGARPDVGRAAAEEAMDEILSCLDGCNMVFITAGMGGGTGTGAAPVIARAAREQGILTVGVVTKPFHFEGVHRMRLAESGINELTQHVDTLIIIPNQNLFRIANEKTTFADAFKMADDVLESGVRGVTDLMVLPGLINLDFNDIRTVMTEMGKAMMGTGEGEGENRAIAAAEAAIANPLLDDVSMRGARGVLINITGGPDLTLFEVDEAANKIREQVDPEANIIFGSCLDDKLAGKMRVSIVATGIDVAAQKGDRPVSPSLSLIATDRDRRRAPAQPSPAAAAAAAVVQPQLAPAGHAASGPAVALAAQPAPQPQGYASSLRSQPVTMGATARVLEPEHRSLALELPAEARMEEEPAPRLEVLEEEVPQQAELHYQQQDYAQAAPLEPYQETHHAADHFAHQVEAGQQNFVAPAPVMPDPEPPMAVTPAPVGQPDPFREAELANASRQPEGGLRARGNSLISKVTGLGRLLGGAQPAGERRPEAPEEPRVAADPRLSDPRGARPQGYAPAQPPLQRAPRPAAPLPPRTAASQPRAEGRGAASGTRAEPAVPAQPRLNLGPAERQTSSSEEQMLDIPAFLRRQAN